MRPTIGMLAAIMLLASGAQSRAAAPASVTQYHATADRSGAYVVPGLTFAAAGRVHRDPRFDGRVPGAVYAQPLFWQPPDGGAALVVVATERNVVVALDAVTGRTVWKVSLGAPVPAQALPCGDIDPLGITGTPIIDPARGALYLDAMVRTAHGSRHFVFGISLKDGRVLPGWPVDVAAALRARGIDFTPQIQNQRAALALMEGHLYVPYGGLSGDCGPYHGWVVSFALDRPGVAASFATRARKGGIWGLGGIVTAGGKMLVTTGNTEGAQDWSGGEAVIRLGPDLRWPAGPADFFAPANWREMDDADQDLAGSAPIPLNADGRGLVLAFGKNGRAYLLDQMRLGGIGGALVNERVSDWPIISAPVSFSDGADEVVVFQGRDGTFCPAGERGRALVALRVTGGEAPLLKPMWCAPFSGRGQPVITTSDGRADRIVWVAGGEGDGRLHGFRADTGRTVFKGGGAADATQGLRRFVTILVADRRLYVAGDDRLYAFVVP